MVMTQQILGVVGALTVLVCACVDEPQAQQPTRPDFNPFGEQVVVEVQGAGQRQWWEAEAIDGSGKILTNIRPEEAEKVAEHLKTLAAQRQVTPCPCGDLCVCTPTDHCGCGGSKALRPNLDPFQQSGYRVGAYSSQVSVPPVDIPARPPETGNDFPATSQTTSRLYNRMLDGPRRDASQFNSSGEFIGWKRGGDQSRTPRTIR